MYQSMDGKIVYQVSNDPNFPSNKEIFKISVLNSISSSLTTCSVQSFSFVTNVGAMVSGFSDDYYNIKKTSTGIIMYPRSLDNQVITLTLVKSTSLKCSQVITPTKALVISASITDPVSNYGNYNALLICSGNYVIGPLSGQNPSGYEVAHYEQCSMSTGAAMGAFSIAISGFNSMYASSLKACDGTVFYDSNSMGNMIFKSSTGNRYLCYYI